jgi:hypothetical protein
VTEWSVDGVIPKRHAILLLGQFHSGMVWLAEQLAVCVASGHKFLDQFQVEPQPVIVIDEESGTNSLIRRFHRLARGVEVDLTRIPLLCYSRCGFILWDTYKRKWLKDLVKQQRGSSLVIVHSLDKVMTREKPNATGIGARAGEFWHEVRDAGTTVIMVHQTGMKRKTSIEDWDLTYRAPGTTMLVEGFDTAICTFRAPVAKTEFLIKPQERRVKLKVRRPFSIVLQEDESRSWAKLAVTEELPELASNSPKHIRSLVSQ